MKQHNGFISNSSSSSFIVYKEGLTEEQFKELRNYVEFMNCLGGQCEAEEYDDNNPPWYIEDDEINCKNVNIFDFRIDYCLNHSEIVRFFRNKYGKNVEELF